ncbi:MAG: glycosyltransferase [Pseudomonadota bacterium]
MIFLTVGTHEPFERLVKAVDTWVGANPDQARFFGQITEHGYRPEHFPFIDRLSPTEYQTRFDEADLIISHAGMGTILTALSKGKPVVILPRRGHLSETRNDHQYTTVKHLGHRQGVYVAQDETELGAVLSNALSNMTDETHARVSDVAPVSFTNALRTFITQT